MLYSSGTRPTLGAIFARVSKYFARFPVGLPLPVSNAVAVSRQPSEVKAFNRAIAHVAENLDVLYEAVLEHVDEVMVLTGTLQGHLERLRARRRRVEAQVDDYLLSLHNTDGYYYSASDTFSDMALTDLSLTSAQVDVGAGYVTIPAIGGLSAKLPRAMVGNPVISATVEGAPATAREVAPFAGALEEDLDNLVWAIEIDTNRPVEVVVQVDIPFVITSDLVELSRVDFTPYGVTPVQMYVETREEPADLSTGQYRSFGNRISTSAERMVFTDQLRPVANMRLTLRKTAPDLTVDESGGARHRYIFGARQISFMHQVYDSDARFISARHSFPDELGEELVMDAVSLVVDDDVPEETSIDYYVAADDGEFVAEYSQLEWRQIYPVGRVEGTSVVRFDGAQTYRRTIRSQPTGVEIPLIALDQSAGDLTKRNPTPTIVPGADTYRLCAFVEPALPSSFVLEEGVNTSRISYVELTPAGVSNLDFWVTKLVDPLTRIAYGRIDGGNDFFYGGDIGESNVSAFVETFVQTDVNRPTFLAEFIKGDLNSQAWDVRVYLNGREIGNLPAGVNRALLPWTLREGLNHVILLVNIPTGRSVGTVRLMGDGDLFDFGIVKLATWTYVDLFDLRYNSVGQPTTFSLHNGEIVSRRRPTDNFRLTYAKATGEGPSGLRFRADFLREPNNPTLSPRLAEYRIRFSYAHNVLGNLTGGA
jgi:hypothetical protein